MNLLRARTYGYLSTALALAAGISACAPSATAPTASPGPAASPTRLAATPTPVGAVKAGLGIVKAPYPGEAQTLTAGGATFPAPLYTKWFNEYEKVTNVKVNYQAIGSGGGIKGIQDQTFDFAGSDATMTDAQLQAARGGELLHIPTVIGAVVATYNVPELTKPLQLSPETLAGIFLGAITRWDDPKLAADNPGVTLPNKDIVTVHRSDGSGTTYAFTDYLSKVSPEWKSRVGNDTSVNWPGGLGASGNQGVTGEVKQNPYSIGYVDLIYAIQNNLGISWVKNKAGNYVEPTLQTVTNAAAGMAGTIPPDLRASIVNADGPDAYPIATFTYFLIYKNMPDKAKAEAVTRMAWWAIHDGQQYAADLAYSLCRMAS